MARFSLAREEVRRAWRELRGGAQSPARLAAAVAIGIFVGSQPIFGCHTPIVLFLCVWFQLDAALAWVASNVSNPFFAPFLLTAEVQVGAYLRTGAPIRFDSALAREAGISGFAGYAFLGAPVVGLGLALVGGLAVYGATAARRALAPGGVLPARMPYALPDSAPPWVRAVENVAQRYAPPASSTPAERSRFHYVRVKLLTDPVAKLIADVAAEEPGGLGEVVDLGTGRGQLPLLLLELGLATRARGVDWDADKIAAASAAAAKAGEGGHAAAAEFARGDARTAELGEADSVLLIDLVHYFTLEEQDAILRRAAAAVRPGGRLLVREADTGRGLRSAATLLEERLFTWLRFNRGERVKLRPAREMTAVLEGAGLACDVRPAWGKTPFANVLIVARRPA